MAEPTQTSTPAASTPAATPAPKTGAVPIGAELVSGGNGSERQPGVPGSIHGSASPVDLNDDSMVRIPGQDQPVRYGDLYKRLQGDYTKKTQAAAAAEKKLRADQQAWQQQRQNEEISLRNTAAALLAKQGQQGQPSGSDFMSKLEAAPYLDGKTAAQILRTIQTEGFGNVVKAIQDRDTVMTAQNNRIVQLERIVQQLSGVHQGSALESRIGSVLKDLDIPEEAADWAKEIYSAYEGDDLDEQFPQILQERWNQLEQIQRKRDQARVNANRRQPFLPGKGGNGTTSKPIQMRGDENAREMADMLWDSLGVSEKT